MKKKAWSDVRKIIRFISQLKNEEKNTNYDNIYERIMYRQR